MLKRLLRRIELCPTGVELLPELGLFLFPLPAPPCKLFLIRCQIRRPGFQLGGPGFQLAGVLLELLLGLDLLRLPLPALLLELLLAGLQLRRLGLQFGWKVLKEPEDFTAIQFNMASVGPGVEKQKEAARQIVAATVQPKGNQVVVSFYSWHLIGGYLRKWQVEIGPKPAAKKQELGQFGGGGYD